MKNQSRNFQLRRQIAYIDLIECADQAGSIFRSAGDSLELVEPATFFAGGFGNKKRSKNLPESRMLFAPADLDQLQKNFRLFENLWRFSASLQPGGISAIQNELSYLLRMTQSVSDRYRPSLRNSEKRKPIEVCSFNHRFQVTYPGVE